MTSTTTKPEDILPEGINQTNLEGINIRKGTVAAFLQNTKRWQNPTTSREEKEELFDAIQKALPILRVLGMFEVFQFQDKTLQTLSEEL
ncbi:hypothetical protein EBI01_18715 [Marinomonas rhizomae]|uniref:DUF7709 domain-containing protein n=1 Tax=Marinomonas rhizomae TaxID=491948 RepID=A0A366JBE1_9GAMM|nr:hypothetical protein [Marinomonas rhizomae]RBP83689.1 hypothetical protein DFP80_1059 [Marinomonas rhizomae]RNF69680.1 hypothetical protein EBI01_18715 [Marinomonas rhizomae]